MSILAEITVERRRGQRADAVSGCQSSIRVRATRSIAQTCVVLTEAYFAA